MKILFTSLLFLLCSPLFAQENQTAYSVSADQPEWIVKMYGENPNLFELRELYHQYYRTHPFVKNQHTQYFKRLMKEYWTSTDEYGFIQRQELNLQAEATYLARKAQLEARRSASSEWQEMGPWEYDHDQAMAFYVQSPGSAHVYTVEQDPSDPLTVYAGTATAGLWKSTDKGLTWTLKTQNLLVNSVYSIVIDPTNPNRVFFGEENGRIWRSEDGGTSWNSTGSLTFQLDDKWIRDMKWIGPNTLLAATNLGLFRTTDNGDNWVSVHAGEHMELEIQPGNFNTIYTVRLNGERTEFYKSTDNGLTWVITTAGWPVPLSGDEQRRTEISVSAADPLLVYAWAAGRVGTDEGLYGVYKSTDGGESFNFICCGNSPGGTPTVTDPNMLGWSENGAEGGGQYYYDLTFGVSPTDPDRVFGAGINTWRSDNGGIDWEQNAHWVTWVGQHTAYRYNHADVHDIKFFQHAGGTDMWIASDGGLYYSSDQGDTLKPRMHGIQGTDFWGFQAGFKDGDIMVGGTYHNGTFIKYKDIYHGGLTTPESGGWLAELGGDNFRGFVNYGDSRIGYSDNGSFLFSPVREERITSRTFADDKKCNTSYINGEYGNYAFSPVNYNTFYSPVDSKLFLTENGGVSFSEVFDFGGINVIQVKVAWSNPDVIYVTHKPNGGSTKIRRSLDRGLTWTDVTPTSAQTGGNHNRPKYIEVDEEDPNKIWCILMGGQLNNKVFKSVDGGSTWINLTTPLLNDERVISLFHHYGTDDGIYIGTERAVYYRNNTMSDWALFNNNLPASVSCKFLEPYYAGGKLRTASQRGVYECDFYEDAPPSAMIASDVQNVNLSANCFPDSVQFVDHSTVRSASGTWQWYFEGGSPATSTLMNPKIQYDAPGTYDVKLVVTDAFGSDSILLTDFITVTEQFANPAISEAFEGDFPPPGWELVDSDGASWEQDWPENDPNNKCASYPNYWINATGQAHYLAMPAFDFTGAINPEITFDYAYHFNGSYEDSLALVYRTGNNTNWQEIWIKGGQELTSGNNPWFWYDQNPTVSWVTETVDLSFLAGEACVQLAFSNKGTNGNHIWLDNVNIDGQFSAVGDQSEELGVSVFPNPSTGSFMVRWSDADQQTEITVYNIRGELVRSTESQFNSTELDLTNESSGVYLLKVTQGESSKIIRIVKR
jgi:PKD repeat protein